MAAGFYQLPSDSANTGKKIRTFRRTVGADNVDENCFHIVQNETAAFSSVAAAGADTLLLAANQERRAAYIWNESSDSEVRVKLGSGASATSYTFVIPPGAGSPLPVPFAGLIHGFWVNPSGGAISGTARISEVTP